MLLRNLLTIVATIFFADTALAQDAANVKKPLEAVLQSTTWVDVLSKDHDLTATVHFGEEENARVSTSNEGICISRQLYDSQSGKFWIPYARGSFELKIAGQDVSPVDRRYLGILVGERDEAQETSFNGQATSSIRRPDAIKVANPIDLRFVATYPFGLGPTPTPESAKSFDALLAKLDALDSSRLRTTDEVVDKRSVCTYRIKGVPLPTSEAIPTFKIVVSKEGFDKGQVLQISRDFMKLDDEAAYEYDKQLIGDYKAKCNFHWREFELEGASKKKVKTLLPISISKTYSTPQRNQYMNVSFEWNSFDKPKAELLTIESGEKIAKEFDARVNQALNR